MGRLRSRLYKTDRARDFEHEQDRQIRTRQVYETIDRQSFQWIVVLVAGIGFFLDGYTLFASNMALPMVSYVFWRDETSGLRLMCINIATLAGTLLGQVSFGYLADRYGRKKMYGVELTLLITSTLGVVMSSTGVNGSMDVFSWLIWWRIVVGIGVGADYPLSAVITSEFAPTKHRARMMATVFFMQPLGQIAGNLVALIVIAASKSKEHETVDVIRSVDTMWRWVIGIGVIPGAIATLFRFAIPESPRFLMEIEDDPVQAEFDATNLFNQQPPSSPGGVESVSSWNDLPLPSLSINSPSVIEEPLPSSQGNMLQPATLNSHWRLTHSDIIQYFWTEGNWRTLVATTFTWLLMDFSFYGISLSSPQFLAKTWGTLHLSGGAPPWQTDDRVQADIYQMFLDSSVHGLVILNSGSFLGCLLLILLVYRLDRVGLQKWAFLALSALFIAMGTMFITVHNGGPVAIVLYIIAQTLFNFGPNATTYIIPAEIFPTRYRATCHGISGAGGKLGSILVQLISNYYRFGSAPGNEATIRHGYVLIVFSACMILGAAVTHFWIPPVQRQNGKGKLWGGKSETLETLALGRLGGGSRYAGPGSRGRIGSGRPVSFASWGV